MLPHEIEPYADAHIEELKTLSDQLAEYDRYSVPPPIERLAEWFVIAKNAERALHRFKVCMADEVEQKERYRQSLQDHKIRPNLKPSS